MVDSMTEVPSSDAELAVEVPLGPSVGEVLRRGREAAGRSLEEVAQTLKLGPRQVQALEEGDWASLPGPTFVRGFVRNYARLIGLDAEPLMAQLTGEVDKPVTVLAMPEVNPKTVSYVTGGRKDRTMLLVSLALMVAAGLGYLFIPADTGNWREDLQGWMNSWRREEPATVTAPVGTPAIPTAPAAPVEPVFPPGMAPQQVLNPQAQPVGDGAAPIANGLPGVSTSAADVPKPATDLALAADTAPLVFVVNKDSWVEVRDARNNVVFSQRLTKGARQPVSGQGPFSVVVGNAPGVSLIWRGQGVDLGPHTRGDVARLVLE